jgi:hypothetical protein
MNIHLQLNRHIQQGTSSLAAAVTATERTGSTRQRSHKVACCDSRTCLKSVKCLKSVQPQAYITTCSISLCIASPCHGVTCHIEKRQARTTMPIVILCLVRLPLQANKSCCMPCLLCHPCVAAAQSRLCLQSSSTDPQLLTSMGMSLSLMLKSSNPVYVLFFVFVNRSTLTAR